MTANNELDRVFGGEDGVSPIRFHSKAQHGGWATAAIRRGEQYAACNTCGMPRHPRLVIRQAVHVPPPRPWYRYAVAVAGIVAFLAVVAQAGPY